METSEGTITYPNGEIAIWKGSLTFVPVRKNGRSVSNIITGTITGVTKRSESFETKIIEPIQYNYDCENMDNSVPVKGIMKMDILKEQSTVNYGDGTCDKVYTLTVEDRQTQHNM
jgi:hypothetical protein